MSEFFTPESIFAALELLRKSKPIVHNLTNYVSMDFVANGLLALGASPIMAHAAEELEEIIALSSVVAVNIGTLDSDFIPQAKRALQIAGKLRKPCVLDPVGCGASQLRISLTRDLLASGSVDILRGNASEILSVLQDRHQTRGVDSSDDSLATVESAKLVANHSNCTVAVSGRIDMITDGKSVSSLSNGHSMMAQVTGMGCLASAICAAFLAVEKHSFAAAHSAMSVMGVCGTLASKCPSVQGPGSFRVAFLDYLSELNERDISKHLKAEVH